jgi:hypothetical protein
MDETPGTQSAFCVDTGIEREKKISKRKERRVCVKKEQRRKYAFY